MTFDRRRLAQRAAILSLVSTIVVVAVKLLAAVMSGAISVLAEALQSTVDIMMSAVAVFALRYAAQPADPEHPYGHGKAEALSGAALMVVLLGSSVFILWQAGLRLMEPVPIRWDWGAAAMLYTALANTVVSAYVARVGRKTESPTLMSEAMHLRGDTLSSMGVLVGMVAVGVTGQYVLDPIAAVLFTAVAMVLAVRQLARVIHPLMDGALPEIELQRLEEVLDRRPEVRGYHNVRTRKVGAVRFIEMHLLLEDDLAFVRAHEIAEMVEDELCDVLGDAVVTIHYEPYEVEMRHRAEQRLRDDDLTPPQGRRRRHRASGS